MNKNLPVVLELNATDLAPLIYCDPQKNIFTIEGKSLLDNPALHYDPLKEWLTTYSKKPNATTVFNIKFEYYNPATARELLDIFAILETIPNAKICWHFLEDDEDMEESGQELMHLVKVPFEFKAY